MPRLVVPVKPRFSSLRSSTTWGSARAASAAKYASIAGSGEASSISTSRYAPRVCASTLSTQRATSAGAL